MNFRSTNFRALFLAANLIVAACSAPHTGDHENTGRFVKGSGFSADPLNYTAVSRTLLTEQNYFVSYSQSSGRLGIIDADKFVEIWGTYIDKSIPFVFNLPGYEGAGFVDTGSFTVVIREGMRKFNVPGVSESSWNRARSVIALAGFNAAARTVHVIRFRGDNNWEEAAIEAFSADSGVSGAGVIVSDQAKLVLVINSGTGSYAVLSDQDGAYALRHTCINAATSKLTGAVIDEISEQAYVASDKQILKIDLRAGAACSSPETWPEVLIGTRPFSDIGLLNEGRFYTTESEPEAEGEGVDPGRIHVLTRTGDSVIPSPSFSVCNEPTGVNTFGSDGLVVTCVNRSTPFDPDLTVGGIENVNLNFYSGSGESVSSKKIGFDRKAGVVFYPQKSEFFEVFDSAAGEVVITDVAGDSSRKVGGIYLDGILNKL